jgi:hypothetical protein
VNLSSELQHYVDAWKNEDDYNVQFHSELTEKVNRDPMLKRHRDWVEQNQFGFGDRAFGWVWKMLVDQMPQEFSFLEIGVFKAQTLSLVALLAKNSGKKASVYGITTLENTRDVRCQYPAGDYRGWISQIHQHFEVTHPVLFVGRSNNPTVVQQSNGFAPYDLCYVDAGHDSEDVKHDILQYAPMTKVGGFLAMDDASNLLNIGSCWPGLEQVSEAVRDHLENDDRFKHLFACGHLRIFQRIK